MSFANYLDENYNNVVLDDEHLAEYLEALFDVESEPVNVNKEINNKDEVQLEINKTNFDLDFEAALEAVAALFEEDDDVKKLVKEVKKLDEIKAMVYALVDPTLEEDAEENEDVVALKDEIENIKKILSAREVVYELFDEEEELLADQDAIDTAQNLVDKIDKEDYNADIEELNTIIEDAQGLYDSIAKRVNVNEVLLISNPSYKDKGKLLGYWVQINFSNEDKEEGAFTVADTESIIIELYFEGKLLGKQSLNATGYEKHSDSTILGGTIDIFGEYIATSWDHEWYGDLTEIPDSVKVVVKYNDNRIVKLQNDIKDIDPLKLYAVVVTEATNTTEMRNALVDFLAKIEDDDDVKNYLTLSNTVKLEVAELVLDAIVDIEDEDFKFADSDYVTEQLTEAMKSHDEKLELINGIKSEDTSVKVEEALSKFEYEAYDVFTEYADRLAIAEIFKENLEFNEDEGEETTFKTLEQVRNAIDVAIDAYNNLI